jgi:hypothetical protein
MYPKPGLSSPLDREVSAVLSIKTLEDTGIEEGRDDLRHLLVGEACLWSVWLKYAINTDPWNSSNSKMEISGISCQHLGEVAVQARGATLCTVSPHALTCP